MKQEALFSTSSAKMLTCVDEAPQLNTKQINPFLSLTISKKIKGKGEKMENHTQIEPCVSFVLFYYPLS